jgi:agmatinase
LHFFLSEGIFVAHVNAHMATRTPFRALGTASNFLGLPATSSSFDASKIVVLPAPYEHTVSYGKGTRSGPAAVLRASRFVEFYDEEFGRELCFDRGIATLPPLTFGKKVDRQATDHIEDAVTRLLNQGKFVVTLGGEHTISLGPIAAHMRKFPDLSVLQIDAHSDLRESYEGSAYSHASVMARVAGILPPNRIVQAGIRAQCIEEARYIRANKVNTFYAHEIRAGRYAGRPGGWQREALERLTDHVYVTFDVDGLDPSVMPSTGTPEPNGLLWAETVDLLRQVGEHRTIVGFDVVELAPSKSAPHADLTAAKLVYKLMNCAFPETP